MFIKYFLLFHLGRFNEFFLLSPTIRKISYYLYRKRNGKEFYLVKQNTLTSKGKKIIGISVPGPYVFEHIKELWSFYGKSPYESIIIGPSMNDTNSGKKDFQKYFEEKYDAIYYRNIIPHPWVKYLNPEIIIDTSLNTYAIDVNVPRVLYTHGMAGVNYSKDLFHIKYVNNYSALFLNGKYHKKAMIIASEHYGVKLPEMYEIGYLRGDLLKKMAHTFKRLEYLKKNDLEDMPIVIFAPTWGFFSALEEWFDSVIEVAENLDINLLLRLHPLTTSGPKGEYWKDRIASVLKTHKRIRVENSHNIDDILLAGDLLITDVSGLSMEFMTLNKPVTFLPAPLYFKLYGENRPEKWVLPKQEIKTKQDLKMSILENLKNKFSPIDVNELVYNRGNALPTMVLAIDEIMKRKNS